MKTSHCRCGNRIFFNNQSCLACGREVGRCDHCHALSSMTIAKDGLHHCDQPNCGLTVVACSNRINKACNSFVMSSAPGICRWCELTTVIPDLSHPKNFARWGALEAAKRRLLIALEQLHLPPYIAGVAGKYPLTFHFLAPTVLTDGTVVPVSTGHADGLITISAEEADSDRREATRIALREPQRTLIGHMRHEIGHYLDWCYASRVDLPGYIDLFGDPSSIDYEQAKQRHYNDGPPADWPARFVSAYASMHPWEDFAETVNAYLDMMAIAETANDQGLANINTAATAEMPTIVSEVLRIAITISEFNSDLGLQLLLPEQLPPPTIAKLAYVHRLRMPELRQRLIDSLASVSPVAA